MNKTYLGNIMNKHPHINAEHIELIADEKTPYTILVDKEEQNINHYREAAKKFINIMSLTLSYIMESNNKTLALITVGYALDIPEIHQGKSQREMARDLGLSHATISWNVKQFLQYANLDL